MQLAKFIMSMESSMSPKLFESVTDAYLLTHENPDDEDMIDIVYHSDRVDYKLSEMLIIDYFNQLEQLGDPIVFKQQLELFAKFMYSKYMTYTKSNVNPYMDNLSDENIRHGYQSIVSIISSEMKDWEYKSDTEMLHEIKMDHAESFENIRNDLGNNIFNDFIKKIFISEKMNRLYHFTKEKFIPQLRHIMN